ncbi:MAG: UDP-N-acetylmuramate--L-alanine ligase [Planctomycetota bacterium]|nr:MAG: UDP-N-acetylmuramate--L-alanine ligase [Planctomycetota bacterium]
MNAHTEGVEVERAQRSPLSGRHVHMIGVGGAGMSGAASMLLELGAAVSGSDLSGFDGMGTLVAQGARIAVGHDAAHLPPETEWVVVSAAVPDDNPELVAARKRGCRVLKYAQLLGLLMDGFPHRIAVAGTHGKSTTTGMTVFLCRACGLDPSFVVGATSAQLGGGSGIGAGETFIAEACEFDRSFLHLRPTWAAILNIEPDHLDYYGSFDAVVEAFRTFAAGVAGEGGLIVNSEDPLARSAARGAGGTVETFGFDEEATWRAVIRSESEGCCRFDVRLHGERLLTSELSLPGRHNVANALAATALTVRAGGDPSIVAEALPDFRGVDRRLSWRGKGKGVTIVDDYAHHPTEIRVSLKAVRDRYRPRRMWVVFQPHQAARTRHFLDDFAASFDRVEEVIVPNIYGARETDEQAAIRGAEELVLRIRRCGGRARYVSTLRAAASRVAEAVGPGDLVLTMGAGDVWKVADELVERFCRSNGA